MNIKGYKYINRSLIVFIILEVISIILILNPNFFQIFPLKNIHIILENIDQKIIDIKNYASIKSENKRIINENKNLKTTLLNLINETIMDGLNKSAPFTNNDKKLTTSVSTFSEENKKNINLNLDKKYELISCKIINNSIIKSKNYITINKGSIHGIKPNMGVISQNGIVGKIKYVSKKFSTVVSILNRKMNTSIKLNNSKILGTLKWKGIDPNKAQILYIPKYANLAIGEKVVTSGFNAIFPENISIGKIIDFKKKENKLFYKITISLDNNFASLENIYVIKNNYKDEIKKIESETKNFYK